MSSHLPECSLGGNTLYEWMDDCICDNLRACRDRTLDEAKAAVRSQCRHYNGEWCIYVAAIDALRGQHG